MNIDTIVDRQNPLGKDADPGLAEVDDVKKMLSGLRKYSAPYHSPIQADYFVFTAYQIYPQ